MRFVNVDRSEVRRPRRTVRPYPKLPELLPEIVLSRSVSTLRICLESHGLEPRERSLYLREL